MSPRPDYSSEHPFKVDGDRPLRMKIATLGAIIVGIAAAVGYGVNLKNEVSIDKLIRSQGELVQRLAHVERMMGIASGRQSMLPPG